jgi:predicted phage tail component-like protein
MPTIKDSLYFTYDGVSCKTFNLINVNLSNGMFEEKLVADRAINELKVRGNEKPLFHGVEEEPLEFEMTIAFEKPFTNDDIDDIILWLFQDNYKPLFFEDKPDRVYYCMPIGEATLAHTGLREGYFTITMRCNSSRIYSPLQTTPTYDLSNNTGTYNVNLVNAGHLEIYPEISIEKVGDGHIAFTREDGEIFEIRNLTNGEKIYINCEKEIIETDIVGVYRYENVVGDYYDMGLKVGTTRFGIQGKCKIAFRYTYKYKF